jgi:hypothetical protein
MENSTNVNSFIGSLPRLEKKKVWNVIDKDGNVVQGVSATDNRKSTAAEYIAKKYPGMYFTLMFSHCKNERVAVSR